MAIVPLIRVVGFDTNMWTISICTKRTRPHTRFRYQEVISLTSQNVILKQGREQHKKYMPFAFTEQGVAMLSSVLCSPLAIQEDEA